MTGPGEGAATAAKILAVIKELPLWLFAGLTLSASALLFFPGIASAVPASAKPWIIMTGVGSAGLAITRAAAIVLETVSHWWLGRRSARKFHITADPQGSFWHSSKQPDGSVMTQISARFLVKNLTDDPLAVVSVRLVKPRLRGEVVSSDVSTRAADRNIYGRALQSGYVIPPKVSLPASAHMMIRSVPWPAPKNHIRLTIALRDDEGREERAKMTIRVMPQAQAVAALPALEIVSSLSNPVERQVAAVLQAELSRYDKCGRSAGGFGSVHLVVSGQVMTSFGGDG